MRLTRTRDDEGDASRRLAGRLVGRLLWRLQDRRPTWLALLAFSVALAFPVLRAGERVPVQRPAQDDSIATAGRQLDAVKSNSANAANTAGGSALPQIAVPSLQPSADTPAPVSPIIGPNDPSQRARSAHWLVDAMMKPDERKTGNRQRDPRDRKEGRTSDKQPSGDREDRLGHPDGPVPATNESRSPERTEPSEAASPMSPTDPAFNPLARYMAGWLAPQDYALLRRTLEAPSSGTSRPIDGTPGVPGPVDSTTPTSVTDLFSDFGGPGKRGAGATEKPADNPYLEALTLPTAPPLVQTPSPVSVPEPTALPQVTAPEPSPRPAIPPFVRPASDDKYFKPLKRF